MLVNKIEVAKDTVHQFTNQVITVSDTITQSSRDYITRDEVLDIFQQNQELYNYQLDFIIGFAGLAITVFGLIIPIIQLLNNRKSEKAVEKDIDRFDKRIDKTIEDKTNIEINKSVLKFQQEFNAKLEESLKELKNETEITKHISAGHVYFSDGHYSKSIDHLIDAAIYSLRLNDLDNLRRVLKNIRSIRNIIAHINDNEIRILPTAEYSNSIAELLYLSKEDTTSKAIVSEIIETLSEIFSINESNDKKDEDK